MCHENVLCRLDDLQLARIELALEAKGAIDKKHILTFPIEFGPVVFQEQENPRL